MLVKSESIVLRKTAFAENSAVVSIFTRHYGILTFLVPGMQGKSGKAAMLQPGNILELVYYYQENKNLKRLKDMKLADGFHGYNQGPVQLQTMLFCLEILQKSLPEEQEDPSTFLFASRKLIELSQSKDFKWFPLQFLLAFTEVSGLGLNLPQNASGGYLMLQTGSHHAMHTGHKTLDYLDHKEADACRQLLLGSTVALDKLERRLLTEKLLNYVRYHLFPEKELRSFPILMEVLE